MGSSTSRPSLRYVRGSWESSPTLSCGDISSLSPCKRTRRGIELGIYWCRWDVQASTSRGSGRPSTCPANSLDPTRGGTRCGSMRRTTSPPLCRSSLGASLERRRRCGHRGLLRRRREGCVTFLMPSHSSRTVAFMGSVSSGRTMRGGWHH